MKKIISTVLGILFAFSLNASVANAAAKEVRVAFFLEWPTPNQEDKVKKLFDKGHLVFGPFAADGFFGSQSYARYDAVLAMYHDQGLIPFKTLSFGKGVNFTAGLNQVRTSPDHGTAFDIAGQGKADASSFREALFAARSIYLKRGKNN